MQVKFSNILKRFRKCESGATLVEYGIAITLAVVVGGVLLTQLATAINGELAQAAGVMTAQ